VGGGIFPGNFDEVFADFSELMRTGFVLYFGDFDTV
jgi:hypothetical protein